MKRTLKFVDMFSGLGGFHLGLQRLGHRCVFACEKNPELVDLYRKNFSLSPASDIRALEVADIPAHDIFCGGFPCQPFSKAGEQLGLGCKKDGDLFQHIVRILKFHLPQYVILENVANLERHNNGVTYAGMKLSLEKLGYSIDHAVLSPHSFGIPQFRRRLFIVGRLGGLTNFKWPDYSKLTTSIYDILDTNPQDARDISIHYLNCIDVWQEFIDRYPKNVELPSFPIWSMEFGADYPFHQKISTRALAKSKGSFGIILADLPPAERYLALPVYAQCDGFPLWKQQFIKQNRELYTANKSWIDKWVHKIKEFPSSLQKLEWNCKGEIRDLREHILQFRASGLRIKRPTSAPTLIAMTTTQIPIIGKEERYMTVRECSRLQGMGHLKFLPENERRAYRALGNAVNADLVEKVAFQLINR
jgi:DNA (cytosine-5)-methyltransferase 1